jgi:hypothetical protein
MVKHIIPEIHQETDPGFFAWHLLKIARNAVVQTHPKSHRNETYGTHSWQLFFVADEIKLSKEASLSKGWRRGQTN